ncbi:MAG: hypothetical protein WDW38_010083 [Sanguina aurantia]
MLFATILGLLLIPVFYISVRRLLGEKLDGDNNDGGSNGKGNTPGHNPPGNDGGAKKLPAPEADPYRGD